MKTIAFTVLALFLLPAGAFATACANYTNDASVYTSSYSCSIGDKTFSNFTIPSNITTVTPTTINGQEGFTFSGNMGVSGINQTLDTNITFNVATTSGASLIEDASFITLSGVGITGSGSLQITEGLCLNPGGSPPCSSGTALFNSTSGPGTYFLNAHTIFTTTGSLIASKDVLSQTGSTTGTVTITSITDIFSQVPEPASLGLLGAGLLGLAGLLRRRSVKTNS